MPAEMPSGVIPYVDGIEALLTSIRDYVDGLEGSTDGLEALATALNGYVDGLEAAHASDLAKLETIRALLAGTLSVGLDAASLAALESVTVTGPLTDAQLRASVVSVESARLATPTLANVASSATSVTLFASNAAAKQRIIYNDSTAVLYVKFGTTASATSFTYYIVAGAHLEFPDPMYTGRVDGIWASANGNARCTEVAA